MESELGFDRQVAAALVADFLCAERGLYRSGTRDSSCSIPRIVAFDFLKSDTQGAPPWYRRRRKPHRFLSRGNDSYLRIPAVGPTVCEGLGRKA